MADARPERHRRNRTATGRAGETAAATFLSGLGFQVLGQNVRFRLGEIDLIARDGDTLVFVEVKTRTGSGYGLPAEAVTGAKQRQLVRLAQLYLARHNLVDIPCRFDVVSVVPGEAGEWVCSHIRNAFGAY